VSQGEGFHPAFRGYRMDQVDHVLDDLQAQVERQERAIAELRGEPVPVADPSGTERALGDVEAEPDRGAADPHDLAVDEEDPGPGLPHWLAEVWRAAPENEEPSGSPPRVRRLRDLVVLAAYLILGAYVTSNLLLSHGAGYLSQGVQDQQAFEWYFAATAHNITHGLNPLFSNLQNYPDGVNLMANAAVLGLGVPLTPITAWWGASTTFFLIEWLGMSLTAAGWYWLFVRRLRVGRVAAVVGGVMCGFAPGMVSHANGHPNFVAAFLIPVIVDRVAGLRYGGRWVRDGVVLGLLVTWQVFIGEEVLLLATIGLGIVGLVLAAHRRLRLRRLAPGLGLAAGVTVGLAGYPLWWQFFGPQSYSSLWHPPAGNDLAALWGIATRSRGADPWASAALSMNRTEENAFFGIPVWLVAALVVIVLFRRPIVRALAAVVVLASWLSLGDTVVLHGDPTGIPALWPLVHSLPVLENVLPTRFTLIVAPAMGALLALGIDRATRWAAQSAAGGVPPALAGAAGAAVAVLVAAVALKPMVPTPLVVDPRPAMPAFFSEGLWRPFLHGGSLLAAPPPDIADARALEWQVEAGMGFPVAEGYFVGPGAGGDRTGQYGATRTALSLWMYDINAANAPQFPTKEQRAQFAQDLSTEGVDAIVLPDRDQTEALLSSLESLFGVADRVGGVYVWDVRKDRTPGQTTG
jgi:hypothetical protein